MRLSRLPIRAKIAGDARGSVQIVDLSALVREASDDIEALAVAREVVLETTIAPQLLVRGDEDLLRRLALNLLDNATKFNVPGGRVRCAVEPYDGGVRLRVGNTGPGIPDVLHSHVFERFFRADAARTRAGHGLGLALSREIARAHGGDLRLSNASANGWTEFEASFQAFVEGRQDIEHRQEHSQSDWCY